MVCLHYIVTGETSNLNRVHIHCQGYHPPVSRPLPISALHHRPLKSSPVSSSSFYGDDDACGNISTGAGQTSFNDFNSLGLLCYPYLGLNHLRPETMN